VVQELDLEGISRASDEGDRIPVDAGVLERIKAHGAVKRVVVLGVELEHEAREVGARQGLQAQVVEVVVGVAQAQHGEILGGLEDAGDRRAGLGGVGDGGRSGAAGEALDVHGPAGVEDMEGLR